MTTALLRVYDPDTDEFGADDYPTMWHCRIKHVVRRQADDRCVRCGHPYLSGAGEWTPCDRLCEHAGETRTIDGVTEARWRILTVHHLDNDKANCRWWNLAAPCQRCHLRMQGRVHMARVWPWEHSEWFRPYVAGYYAWVYLGEDLPRQAVMDRLDDLLSLERIDRLAAP